MPSILNSARNSVLDQLGVKNNCDKSSVNRKSEKAAPDKPGHDYLRKYEIFLKDYVCDEDFSMLELGAGPDWNIGASLKIWNEYFPVAKSIVVADIKESAKSLEGMGEKIKVVVGDLEDKEILARLDGNYDFIIDDASHCWSHQINSFNYLFDSLKPGGLYIIEDIHTSFGKSRKSYNGITEEIRLKNPEKLDAFAYFSLMSAYVAGSWQYHPFFNQLLNTIGVGLYDSKIANLLMVQCKELSRKIASVAFIKHSCLIVKDCN